MRVDVALRTSSYFRTRTTTYRVYHLFENISSFFSSSSLRLELESTVERYNSIEELFALKRKEREKDSVFNGIHPSPSSTLDFNSLLPDSMPFQRSC